jgi:hypothetical protein
MAGAADSADGGRFRVGDSADALVTVSDVGGGAATARGSSWARRAGVTVVGVGRGSATAFGSTAADKVAVSKGAAAGVVPAVRLVVVTVAMSVGAASRPGPLASSKAAATPPTTATPTAGAIQAGRLSRASVEWKITDSSWAAALGFE